MKFFGTFQQKTKINNKILLTKTVIKQKQMYEYIGIIKGKNWDIHSKLSPFPKSNKQAQ